MCGLAGILRFDDHPVDPPRLAAMLAAIRHRGPDGAATIIAGPCGLAHARLAILDLPGGAQPMTAPHCPACRDLTVVFNGELYNHRELRRLLELRGHRFHSDHCDTEVLLHGYREWGLELTGELQGMFAFALWDAAARRLLLARDVAGKKPLYRWRDGAELRFGSLLSAVLAGSPDRAPPAIDPQALQHYLRFGYCGPQSLLRGIEELPPGHYEVIDAGDRATLTRYSELPGQAAIPRAGRQPTALQGYLRSAIEAAVAARLEADVPLGCFLSGGIDSSIVATLAHRSLQARGAAPLRTFNVRMPDADYDESPRARLVAAHLGTQHLELPIDPQRGLLGDLSRLIAAAGEPTADSSILPTYWLSQAVRPHVPVVLSGDGGDELFGGYERYRALDLIRRYGWLLRRLPTRWLGRAELRSPRGRLRRLADAAAPAAPPDQFARMVELFPPDLIAELTGRAPAATPLPDWPDEPDPRRAAMRWDFAHYLPFDLLRKVDRAAMAVALEVRCPLLDFHVAHTALQAPIELLLPRGRLKGFLRDFAADLGLPPAVTRAPKRGFAIPVGRWFRGPLRPALGDALLSGPLDSLSLSRPAVQRLYDQHTTRRADHTHRLFALLSLALWARWLRETQNG